ncbi:GNAT family N-acetyltransferase [Sphingobacterium paucimobilis]|uniref:N-acetyltransferase domain-containing protein n=1 Tax=Sphingobacterium paucimobilis HER1398 TaxID=1346330 RepID=U2HB72_9SPHI|nr:GNAT family N-acetyltransferase [Sphingobacterium paucimobilis]ERJ58991.1 hypothetical protein M472_09435 [Sphingobacterium paucimobilis HER1398]
MIVVLKATGEILRWCGLIYHPEEDEYDIGYRFYKRNWGKGYATESAKAIIADGFARIGMKQIGGRARVENTASIHVFDKLGMEFVKDYGYRAIMRYAHDGYLSLIGFCEAKPKQLVINGRRGKIFKTSSVINNKLNPLTINFS